MHTRVSLAATRSSCAITRRIASPFHTISCLPSRCRSCRFSISSRCSLRAFSTVSKSLSVEIGFSRKSSAPSRVARTAISMCACPDIITTGAVTPCFFRSSSKREAVFPGHDHVRQNQIKRLRLGQFQSLGRVVAHRRLVSRQSKSARQRSQCVGFIIDNQEMRFRWHDPSWFTQSTASPRIYQSPLHQDCPATRS